MSWIIGYIGNCSDSSIKKIETFAENKLVEYRENNFVVFAGGNAKTCLHLINNLANEKFISVGIGIKVDDNKTSFMKANDWKIISNSSIARKLGGHFINVRWNKNEIKIYTDALGLRDIYYIKVAKDQIIFSTRGDWLSRIIQAEINFKEFGSRWLLFNQLSAKSIFNNIVRINSGTSILINRLDFSLSIDKFNWLPNHDKNVISIVDYSRQLDELITFPFTTNQKVSLSLSGGMDSRLILSYLLNNGDKNWYSHTFGDYYHPDSIVAQRITSNWGIEHEKINMELPTADVFLSELTEYVSLTNVNNAVSGYLQLRNYKNLIDRNEVIVDGGFGEIWRREFFNRLLIRGRKELVDRNIEGMIPYLRVHHANIFAEEIQKAFLTGCKEQLEDIISVLPKAESIGVENWIDLFSIKTRLLNYYSSAQIHLDSWVFSYMPFIQPSILKKLFSIPLAQRKNGKMFREIIKQNFKPLVKYPLAKGQFTHPFFLSTIQARIWNTAYTKLKLKMYNDRGTANLLNALLPYIQDTITSSSVKECSYYDYSKLLRLSNNLTKGTATDFDLYELDWWLAFELFRQGINK